MSYSLGCASTLSAAPLITVLNRSINFEHNSPISRRYSENIPIAIASGPMGSHRMRSESHPLQTQLPCTAVVFVDSGLFFFTRSFSHLKLLAHSFSRTCSQFRSLCFHSLVLFFFFPHILQTAANCVICFIKNNRD